MRARSALFDYQAEAAARIVAKRQLACFLEPGRGKTPITLTALHDLGRPRTLVLAPARVAREVWHREAAEWEHLRGLKVTPASETNVRERLLAAVNNGAHVVCTAYENLPFLMDNADIVSRFDALVLDELSKMKAADATRFRRFRHIARKMPIRIGLTGNPVGNCLTDIWGEMYMVADEKPLGNSRTEFLYRYFRPKARQGHIVYSWDALPGAQDEIHKRIRPWAFTLAPGNAPKLPEVTPNPIRVPVPEHVLEMSAELACELATKLESGADLYAFSGTVAAMKVRQLAGGAVYLDEPTILGEPKAKGPKKWEAVHDEKLSALEELVDELQGEPLLVFTWFRHEQERILARFKCAVTIDAPNAIDRWNRREIRLLVAHPASAGHGINLQHGGHNVCWFTLPYSWEMYRQGNGRLARIGQKSPFVTAHALLAGRADEVVLTALHRKRIVEDALLEAMLG